MFIMNICLIKWLIYRTFSQSHDVDVIKQDRSADPITADDVDRSCDLIGQLQLPYNAASF